MQNSSDEQVMLLYQQGEGAAMDEILQRYRKPVCHFAYRLCRDQAEAEDVAQEVFLRVHQNRLTYVPSAKFSTWIFAIAHNLVISRLRRRKWQVLWPRRQDEPEEPVEFASPDPSPQDAAVANDMADMVQRSIKGLPLLQREALILREYQQLDYEEIASILNTSLGTVKTLIHRARMALKVSMRPLLDEAAGGSHV